MNWKIKVLNLVSFGAVLMWLLSGCYPKGPEYISDYSVVVTDYDMEFDFGSRKTYYMPDTIHFETNMNDISDETLREFEDLILDEFETNMSERGYTRVDTTFQDTPDLVATITAIAVENTGVGWVPSPGWGWWGGYYPPGWGWSPGWGWGYPGWYPVGYSYNTGTVLMHLGDPDSGLGDDDVEIAWFGALDGILSSSSNTNQQAIIRGIDQAFTQSPYLQSNQ